MDILTLSLAVQKTLRELGIDRDIKKTVVLPETTVENNGNGIYICPYVNLTIGETYVVKLNNEIYCTECFDMDGDITIGNRAEVNDGISTGEPFVYVLAENGEGAVCMVFNPDTFEPLPYDSITIEIYQETTTTTPIKSEYLPDLTGKAGTVKLEKTVVLPKTTATATNDGLNDGFIFEAVSLTAGETYTVVFNGAVWKSECIEVDGQIWLGNKGEATGEITREPFVCAVMPDGGLYCIPFDPDTLTVPKLDSVTLEIYQETETIHPIDPKFLPGVCLPVVELSTVFDSTTEEPTVCNESDYQKLEEISDTGTPFVCKFNALFPPAEGSNNKKEEQVCGIFSIIKNIAGVAATAFVGTSLIMLNQSADAEHGKIWVCTIINL